MAKENFCALGVDSPKLAVGVASLWRSCFCFKADFIFSIGLPIEEYESGEPYLYLPKRVVDGTKFLHFRGIETLKEFAKENNARLVAVEWPIVSVGYTPLPDYTHPDRAIYLLGSERGKGEAEWVKDCDDVVSLPAERCLAASAIGSIVLYDRFLKRLSK
jgi:hypothetical protein